MGINIFVLVPRTCDIFDQAVVEELNARYGDQFFDWCDLFKGKGGHRLTVEQALAFEDEAGPFYVCPIGHLGKHNESHAGSGELISTHKQNNSIRAMWKPLVKAHKGDVLFIKARN